MVRVTGPTASYTVMVGGMANQVVVGQRFVYADCRIRPPRITILDSASPLVALAACPSLPPIAPLTCQWASRKGHSRSPSTGNGVAVKRVLTGVISVRRCVPRCTFIFPGRKPSVSHASISNSDERSGTLSRYKRSSMVKSLPELMGLGFTSGFVSTQFRPTPLCRRLPANTMTHRCKPGKAAFRSYLIYKSFQHGSRNKRTRYPQVI
jgi:hypothetical protein